jgi:hypothetical protein
MSQQWNFKTFDQYKSEATVFNEEGSVLVQPHEVLCFESLIIDGVTKIYVEIDFSYLSEKYPNSLHDYSEPFIYRVGSLGQLWTLKYDGSDNKETCFRLVTNKVRQIFKEELEALGIKTIYKQKRK